MSELKTAKNFQNGKDVGRIGYWAPDIVIKGNMIDSITGNGFLYPKRLLGYSSGVLQIRPFSCDMITPFFASVE
jgi:hypothetical protein